MTGSRGELPPLCILAKDSHGNPVDPRVNAVALQLWGWAFRHVDRELHDAAVAAQLVERVAVEVSMRLHDQPAINRNLKGYFITAFRRRVRQQFLRDNRLVYEGLLHELELKHPLRTPDWQGSIETQLCLQVIIDHLPHEARHMLNYRIVGLSWEGIGRALGMSAKQARSRFYYELDKVRDRLLSGQPNPELEESE